MPPCFPLRTCLRLSAFIKRSPQETWFLEETGCVSSSKRNIALATARRRRWHVRFGRRRLVAGGFIAHGRRGRRLSTRGAARARTLAVAASFQKLHVVHDDFQLVAFLPFLCGPLIPA